MMHAAENGWLSIMCLLNGDLSKTIVTGIRQQDSRLLHKNKQKANVLMLAAANGHMHVLWYIFCKLPKYPVDEVDTQGNTALTLAIAGGHLSCVEFLINMFKARISSTDSKNGWSPIHHAFFHKRKKIMKFLIRKLVEINFDKIKNIDFLPKLMPDGEYEYADEGVWCLGKKDKKGRRIHYGVEIIAHLRHLKKFILPVRPTMGEDVLNETAIMNNFVYECIRESIKRVTAVGAANNYPTLLEATRLNIYNAWGILNALSHGMKLHRYDLIRSCERNSETKRNPDEVEEELGYLEKIHACAMTVMRQIRLAVIAMGKEPRRKYEKDEPARRTSTFPIYIHSLYRAGIPHEDIPLKEGDVVEMVADVDHQKNIECRYATVIHVSESSKRERMSVKNKEKIKRYFTYKISVHPKVSFTFTCKLRTKNFRMTQLTESISSAVSILTNEDALAIDIDFSLIESAVGFEYPSLVVKVDHQQIACSPKEFYQKLAGINKEFLAFLFGVASVNFEKGSLYPHNKAPRELSPREDFRVLRSHIQPLRFNHELKHKYATQTKDMRDFSTDELLKLPEVKSVILHSVMQKEKKRREAFDEHGTWYQVIKITTKIIHMMYLQKEENELRKQLNDSRRHERSTFTAARMANCALANHRLAMGLDTLNEIIERKEAADHYFEKAVERYKKLFDEEQKKRDLSNINLQVYHEYANILRSKINRNRDAEILNRRIRSIALQGDSTSGSSRSPLNKPNRSREMEIKNEIKRIEEKMFSQFHDQKECLELYRKFRPYMPDFNRELCDITVTPQMLATGTLSHLHLEEILKGVDYVRDMGLFKKKIHQKNQQLEKKLRQLQSAKSTRKISPKSLLSSDDFSFDMKSSLSIDTKEIGISPEKLESEMAAEMELRIDFSNLGEWLKDPQLFAEETMDSVSSFFEENKHLSLLQKVMRRNEQSMNGGIMTKETDWRAASMTQSVVETVKYLGDIHSRVATMWKNWKLVQLGKHKLIVLSPKSPKSGKIGQKLEKNVFRLLSEQWSEDFKLNLTNYLIGYVGSEFKRLTTSESPVQDKKESDVSSPIFAGSVSDGSIVSSGVREKMYSALTIVDSGLLNSAKPQHEAVLFLASTLTKMLLRKPVTVSQSGLNLRDLLIVGHKQAFKDLKDERFNLEMSWIKTRMELAHQYFHSFHRLERQAQSCPNIRDQYNCERKALQALVEAYRVDPRPIKRLGAYWKAYNQVKKNFEVLTRDKKPVRDDEIDMPDYADRFKLEDLYALDKTKYTKLKRSYKNMITWSNRDALDWAYDQMLHKTNRDIVDVLRDKITDVKKQTEIRISGYHMIKFTANMKEKVENEGEYSWEDLLGEEDAQVITKLVKDRMQQEYANSNGRTLQAVQYNADVYDHERQKKILAKSTFGGLFSLFSVCSGRSVPKPPENLDSQIEDDDEYSYDDEDEDENEIGDDEYSQILEEGLEDDEDEYEEDD
mmetsp:Transcript_27729/g.67449  ORF Transcript_27729/g.67449 Transcript_27729/m.67449 type:complete len:1465 (-) Transcript_27729:235-4629(-)